MPTTDRERLREAVQQAAEGTPYAVSPTADGFDVALDVADARWYGLLEKAGLKKTCVHHVHVTESGSYSITDDSRELEWVAGTPRLGARAVRQTGRVKEISFRKTWAFNEQGKPAKVVDYRFSSEEGRSMVTAAAKGLGLRQVRGTTEKVAIGFAVVGAVGAVITVVVLLVGALLGAF